jgi:hypothetical protein
MGGSEVDPPPCKPRPRATPTAKPITKRHRIKARRRTLRRPQHPFSSTGWGSSTISPTKKSGSVTILASKRNLPWVLSRDCLSQTLQRMAMDPSPKPWKWKRLHVARYVGYGPKPKAYQNSPERLLRMSINSTLSFSPRRVISIRLYRSRISS